MTLDDAVALEPVAGRIYLDVEAMCASVGGAKSDALNRLALDLARRYIEGTVSFRVADAVINNIAMHSMRIAATLPGRTTPEPMFSVFLAFDAGELHPEERFTRPLLTAILAKADGAA
jgi:hypothetical protein